MTNTPDPCTPKVPKPKRAEVGMTFSRWTVLEHVGGRITKCGDKVPLVKCKCACGTIATIDARTLTRKSHRSTSCGCYNSEVASAKMKVYLAKRWARPKQPLAAQ